jgi:hypothetical protein
MICYTKKMEVTFEALSYADHVAGYYSELMYNKAPGEIPTADELKEVSETAATSFLTSDDPQKYEQLADSFGHPFGALWAAGNLDGLVYFEWVYAIERPKAAEQVARSLAKRRAILHSSVLSNDLQAS